MTHTRVPIESNGTTTRPATAQVESELRKARLTLTAALGHIDRGGVMGVRLHVDGAVAAIDDGLTALGAGTRERERDGMLKVAKALQDEGRTESAEFIRRAVDMLDRDTEARR